MISSLLLVAFLAVLAFAFFLDFLVVLYQLWLLFWVPKGSVSWGDGRLASLAVEAMATWAFVVMQRYSSFSLLLQSSVNFLV
jgi:hypothetical protein